MSTGISCELYVDGKRFADGTAGESDLDPVALSGLSIAWGRETTVDQPDASTCEFDVMDVPGGAGFTGLLRTGLPVMVTSTGTLYPAPDVSTILDPGFEDAAVGDTPPSLATNAAVSVTDAEAATGTHSAILLPQDPAQPATVVFAPAPFSALPNAWDEIPSTAPGQVWVVGATVKAPAGSTILISPAYFSNAAGTVIVADTSTEATATGDWQKLELSTTPQAYGRWFGVAVTVAGLYRWIDMPGTWLDTPGTWLDYELAYVDDLLVLSPAGGTPRTVAVFAGRITDLSASWDDTLPGTKVHVTAADFTADLDNIGVGDEPWTVEAMGDRFQRILTLTGQDVDAQIDDSVAGTLVSYQDVDNQAATGLLKDLAQSVDAIMWSAVHQTAGPYLRVEDPSNRTALFTLRDVDGVIVIVPAGTLGSAQDISACDVLRDPIEWVQNVSDVSTRVAVGWLEQGVDEDGNPETTDHTVTLIDPDLEQDYGTRRISVSTLLQSEDDARDVAGRILGRTSLTGWRAAGFTIDDEDSLEQVDDAAIQMMLRLLDGTSRIGLPIRLTDLPAWAPVGSTLPVYLEGGTYEFIDGTWTLALTVSQASAQGQSVPWENLDPAWTWVDFDPSISWLDLDGVMYPPPASQIGAPA